MMMITVVFFLHYYTVDFFFAYQTPKPTRTVVQQSSFKLTRSVYVYLRALTKTAPAKIALSSSVSTEVRLDELPFKRA